jgi:hypothetical protein
MAGIAFELGIAESAHGPALDDTHAPSLRVFSLAPTPRLPLPLFKAGEGWGEGLANSCVDPLTPTLSPLQEARGDGRGFAEVCEA